MLTLIIDYRKQGEETIKKVDCRKDSLTKLSKTEIKLENGNRLITKPLREGAIRGLKPHLTILKCEVTDSFYHRILEPCVGKHGVIIDER